MRVNPDSWRAAEGQFVGNECSFPLGRTYHGCKQLHVNQFVIEQARKLGGRLTLSLDAHFVREKTKMIQDILLQNGNKNGWRASSAYYQMNTQQAHSAWMKHHGILPDAEKLFVEAVEGNAAITAMVQPISIPKKYHLPETDLPIDISTLPLTPDQKLLRLLFRRINHHGRMPASDSPQSPVYRERLSREINVIANNGKINFLPYFLNIDIEICSYARDTGIPVGPGRGSAAGSLLAYLLRITSVDPIVWGLSFERFLSMGRIARGKFPDIDIDLADPKAVVDQLSTKYGEKFARICTTGTAKLKGAIRDVSRIVLNTGSDLAMAERVNILCNGIENMPQGADSKKWLYGYEDGEGAHPAYLEINPELKKFFEEFPEVAEIVDQVLDVPRSVGRHASAYCLSDEALTGLVPMCELGAGEDKELCTQFTMGPVEALGLIKYDFLGLNTLKDVAGCIALVKRRTGVEIDIDLMGMEPWPAGERKIGINVCDSMCYDRFCAGRTETVFQFKSSIATNLCLQVKPRTLLDLANITANGRPGTMYAKLEDGETTLIDAWVMRRQGKQAVSFVHPDLRDILQPTEGIFTYQEQIMAAFVKCCGYTEEKADEIREIVGKKQHEKMEVLLPEIRCRLSERGWNVKQIDSFVSLCVAASKYSFNKSHSVAYAYIGYICMWLKTHYPLEWWNSVLENSSLDDLKDAAKYVREIVVPPNINTSLLDFYIIDDGLGKLVFPLNRVKNVKGAGQFIFDARADRPFVNVQDFYERVEKRKVNKRVVESLIWAGAFDGLHGVTNVEQRNDIYLAYMKARGEASDGYTRLSEPDVMKKQIELLAIGSANFIELMRSRSGLKILDPGEVPKFEKGAKVRTGGLVNRVHVIKIKKEGRNKGREMAFVDLGNESNEICVTVFPDEFQRFKLLLKESAVVLIEGKVDIRDGRHGIIADRVEFAFDEPQESSPED